MGLKTKINMEIITSYLTSTSLQLKHNIKVKKKN